jgi:4-carboxymuconolactone decarboxylase
MSKFDVEARHAEILGRPERIAPLPQDQVTPDVIETSTNILKVMGIEPGADIPPYVRVCLRHPQLFHAHMNFGIMLAGSGKIARRDLELVVLRTGWLCGAPYEWGEHVGIGKRMGLTDEEVARLPEGSAAPGWSARDRAILKAVEELVESYAISDETWAEIASFWSEAQLLEFPIIVGVYVMTGMQQNAIRLRLNAGNKGLNER